MAFGPNLRPLTPPPATDELVGLGCAPIGNLYEPVADADATATIGAALARRIRFFDTAPHYGAGVSELRLGRALAGVDRDSVAIATKVGRRVVDAAGDEVPVGSTGAGTVGDLSRDGVLRSLEGSLRRLGTDRIDLLYLHDPEDVDEALRSALPALAELRAEGVVSAIGVGMVWSGPLTRFVREAELDVVMIAGRVTLLDRRAEADLLPAARDRGVEVVAAGVFNSGILADPFGSPTFDYRPAGADLAARARRMHEICAEYGVRLADAAVRYPLRRPPVSAVVVGARTPAEVTSFADGLAADLPNGLWEALDLA